MVTHVRVIEDDDIDTFVVQSNVFEPRTSHGGPVPAAVRRAGLIDGAALFVLGTIVSLVYNTRASIWFDETATAVATNRTYAQLFQMVQTVDAVHLVYYSVLRPWIALVGVSAETLRAPSALFVGIGAAGMVALGRAFGAESSARVGRSLGLIAGLVFITLPAVSWAGTEARSSSLVTAVVIWATVVLVRAQRATGSRAGALWALYTALAIASVAIFLYAALVIVSHGVALLVSRRGRGVRDSWIAALVVTAVVLTPLVLLEHSEQGQVSWIAGFGTETIRLVGVQQWFRFSPAYAAVAWLVIVLVIGFSIRRHRAAQRHGWAREAAGGSWVRPLSPVVMGVCWLILPTAALLAVSAVTSPTYLPRYVMTSAPAAALLIAIGVTSVRPRIFGVVVMLALVGLGGQAWWVERGPSAKEGSTYSQVAATLQRNGRAGDGIVYERDGPGGTWSTRTVTYAYPSAVKGLIDLTLKTPSAQTETLWETSVPVSLRLARLRGVNWVWYLVNHDGAQGMLSGKAVPTPTDADWKSLVTDGFHRTDAWQFGTERLYLLSRSSG